MRLPVERRAFCFEPRPLLNWIFLPRLLIASRPVIRFSKEAFAARCVAFI
jgi:hypothetical protein